VPKYNIIFKQEGVLVDSGSPYEIYRHMSNLSASYASQYKEFGTLSDKIIIEEIKDDSQ